MAGDRFSGNCPAPQANSQRVTDDLAELQERNARILRRQRLVERIWRLGPRPTYHLIIELWQFGASDLDFLLERYADLDDIDPRMFRALGADRFPPPPLHLVPQE